MLLTKEKGSAEVSHKKNNSNNKYAALPKVDRAVDHELAKPLEHEKPFFVQRTCACGGGCPRCQQGELPVQAKLKIGAPNDKYEQEADRVAEQVMRMPDPQCRVSEQVSDKAQTTHVQRECTECEEEDEEIRRKPLASSITPLVRQQANPGTLQAKEVHGTTPKLSSILQTRINSMRGIGQPISKSERSFFEPRFGCGLKQVRVHTDSRAADAARAVNAKAFTVGQDMVFGSGQYSSQTVEGKTLLAHELTHIVQQSVPSQLTTTTSHVPLQVQRDVRQQQSELDRQLDNILPSRVGLVTVIDREIMLTDIFGTDLLRRHVALIHASTAARQLVRNHGVPGMVALYDTRSGTRLDVPAAQRALTSLSSRYQRSSLNQLRLRPRRVAPPSYWFQDPASQQASSGTVGGPTMTSSQLRAQVLIEPLSQVGSGIFVRFAYPQTEVSRAGPSQRIQSAKQVILQAIAQVVADLGSLPPAASRAERREQKTVRAQLTEAMTSLGRPSPLNVFIATEPSHQELLGGQVAALTDSVFVNLQDVGNLTRLQAAIRMPLLMLRGGVLPAGGRIQQIPAASQADLQRTLLHEALHSMLIHQSSDANSVWQANRTQLTVQGSPSAVPKLLELVRKYLIAHEEVFAYENETSLYPPLSPEKARYESFIRGVESFLRRRSLTLNTMLRSIPVSKRVAGQAVTWTITYKVPSGTISLTVSDIQSLDLLLGIYPLG